MIGYGSIGARHARLLGELGCENAVLSARQVDYPSTFRSLVAALSDHQPDYVVIANATADHFATLHALAAVGYTGHVLVEKPLFSNTCVPPEQGFAGLWVGYNLRFHPLIRHVKKLLNGEAVISVNAYVGQYLPDWRPGTDYRKSYSADATRGGGVLRDLSHELDYLGLLFGSWTRVAAIGGHFSQLEIASDDLFVLLFQSTRCPAITLQASYLDRMVQRHFTINTERRTIIVDFVACSVVDNGCRIDMKCERDATYREMHRAVLTGETEELCSIDQGNDVMQLIAAAEEASAKKRWVFR